MLRELELAEVVALSGISVVASVPTFVEPVPVVPVAAPPVADRATMSWDALRDAVRDCTACGLCKGRKQAVFGVGAESGPWMFIGEGPGADEDEQGEPFVGQAGKLLDAMLAAAGLGRTKDSYIANVVKCRPPGNRTPTLDEANACAAYLDRQIDLVNPKIIVALGKTAATRLLGSDASLASMRGRIHTYRGRPLVVTYHPAYLLRTLPDKAKAWEDLLFARRTLKATLGSPAP
jgi:DNA polymerase